MEEEIKKNYDEVQNILESLRGSEATCLFVGHEGTLNYFTIYGDVISIKTQIAVAMMRSTVFRNIIMSCAENFARLNRIYGDEARNMVMNHEIEVNPGDKEN